MDHSATQKPFPNRKSELVVEGSRAWVPLHHKISRSHSKANTAVQASHEVAPAAASTQKAVSEPANAKTVSATSAPPTIPLSQSTEPRRTERPASPEAADTGAIPYDCSDLVRHARRTFRHVAGMDDTKRRLRRAGDDILAGLDGEPRNGILLHGESGCGKTLLAESLAGELGIPFLSVAFGDMASKWINETPEKLRGLFRTARRCAPCLLLIDEVDSFLKPRDGSSTMNSMDRDVVNTLLKEIVEIRHAWGVVLVAATNYLEQLDSSAIRAGRFDFHIQVPAPDFEARRKLIWVPIAQRFGQEAVDMDVVNELARRWEGFSAARLAALAPQLRDMKRDGEFDGPVTFDLAMRAMRLIQGQRSTLPTHVVPIEDLVMPESSRGMLIGLADRLNIIYDFIVMGGTLPRGILLYGPPGTGKTMAAMSLADSSRFTFLPTTGTDLIARPDEWEKLVRQAKDLRPSIVFIDEADSILADRRHSNVSALTNRILATIDGTGGRVQDDVIYIAATNYPDALDPAVLRGGRFAMQIRFDVPDAADMLAWVESTLDQRQMKLDFVLQAGTAELATELLAGRPIADAQALIDEAINLCAMRFLDGREADHDGPFLRRTDMQDAARTLQFDAGELRS